MIPIYVGIRQHRFLPFVSVTMEGEYCEDEPILIDLMCRIIKFAERKQGILVPENDIPPITKGMKIQVCFTAQFKTMLDADSFKKGIPNI